MNIPLIVEYILVLFGYNFNTPKTLQRDTRSNFDKWCNKIAPYVIFTAIITIAILLLVIFIKYGGVWFGTEANQAEHLERIL